MLAGWPIYLKGNIHIVLGLVDKNWPPVNDIDTTLMSPINLQHIKLATDSLGEMWNTLVNAESDAQMKW